MKKTGAWLVRYALEQLGVGYTFGIPGVHNTELYDEFNSSECLKPILVTHEAGASFMADAVSRTSNQVGVLLIVPAAGAAYASAGIGEAFLDGIPMLVISGGVRTDVPFQYQLHQMDQCNFLSEITKKTYRIEKHADIIPTLFDAHKIALEGEPGPVFIEIPANIQWTSADIENLPAYVPPLNTHPLIESRLIEDAVSLLVRAKKPGLFVGWGARDALPYLLNISEYLSAPVSTTLQGLSVFPANHPLHTGMGFGHYAVPAADKAFRGCDCLLAIGTRFSEIATGSYGVKVPANLIHIDINPRVFGANYKAKVAIEGDASVVLDNLWDMLQRVNPPENKRKWIREKIQKEKNDYATEWKNHNSKGRINPFLFFQSLRKKLEDDDFVVVDDGNHTFLAAELMPINKPKHFISPTDFNCMGYAVPAAIATKLVNPEQRVAAIVGDGAFSMTCMEIITARSLGLGLVFFVFHDGELSQISQAQEIPYNRKTCTVLGGLDVSGVAKATGARFLSMQENDHIDDVIDKAFKLTEGNEPVIVDVKIDYSKRTRFTEGIVLTNLKRFDISTKARFIGRGIARKVTG